MKNVTLLKGKEKSVLRKHPWVFSGAIKQPVAGIEDGEVVRVLDYKGDLLGKGYYQNTKSINVRLITFKEEEIDQNFYDNKISEAMKFRAGILNFSERGTNAYRLFHGEGDGIPGLIIDIYGRCAVIQSHTLGVYFARTEIAKAIKNNYSDRISTIYSKAKDTLPVNLETRIEDGHLTGDLDSTTIEENGIFFHVNWKEGQKTGFFLDQRENRKILQSYVRDKSVLNCFCYTGGFSLYALKAGAKSVTSVDISEKAMNTLNQNLILNELGNNHFAECANVMDFLKNSTKEYDVLIVDPPAFAKSINKKHNAVQAYKRLNALALSQVKKGGILFTFSCSQVIGEQLFYDTIVAAAIESNRNIKVIQKLSQGPDHPVNIYHPEGSYLKGLILYIE